MIALKLNMTYKQRRDRELIWMQIGERANQITVLARDSLRGPVNDRVWAAVCLRIQADLRAHIAGWGKQVYYPPRKQEP